MADNEENYNPLFVGALSPTWSLGSVAGLALFLVLVAMGYSYGQPVLGITPLIVLLFSLSLPAWYYLKYVSLHPPFISFQAPWRRIRAASVCV